MKLFLVCFSFMMLLNAEAQRPAPDHEQVKGSELTIQPIKHATMVLTYSNTTIYIDPVGGAHAFAGLAAPDLILITDIHGDHFDTATLAALSLDKATLIVPKAVADKLPAAMNQQKVVVLNNGDQTTHENVSIKAIPMYNLPASPDAHHPKGRGNGYVLNIGGKNIYISGDTEATPEMRALKNIDIAFVCMNLPYTMDVQQAAEGVLAFQPKIVYPYHYRGQDINTFKNLVEAGHKNIEVRLRNWYL